MPKNTTILLIRHAEKPGGDDTGLAVAGQERAQAYVVYFQNYPPNAPPIKLDYLFASEDSDNSHRPKLTLKPLAQALDLKINHDYKDKDYAALVAEINGDSKYDNSQILICWHHHTILDLAAEFLKGQPSLPEGSNWPSSWPGGVFGWLLQLSFDGIGGVVPNQSSCINQRLMFDDNGPNPPGLAKLTPSQPDQPAQTGGQ